MKRNDVHRPSVFTSSDYEYVCCHYTGFDDDAIHAYSAEHKILRAATKKYGWAPNESAGSCFCCGASASYHGVFLHLPTNKLVEFGHVCAERLELITERYARTDNALRKLTYDARRNRAGKAKAALLLADWGIDNSLEPCVTTSEFVKNYSDVDAVKSILGDGYLTSWALLKTFHDWNREAIILRDLKNRLIKYGCWSLAQREFAKKLNDSLASTDVVAKLKDLGADAVVPEIEEGRYEIEGEIVSIKEYDGDYGITYKLLIKTDNNAKYFGTRPKAIRSAGKGDRVRLTATVTKRDIGFGLFSRPSKAELVA